MSQESPQRAFKGIWIPAEIWLNPELSVQDKILWAEIDSLDGKDGCFASNAYLAKFMKLSEDRIKEIITKLKKLGLIKQKSFDGRTRILESSLNKAKKNQGHHSRGGENTTAEVAKTRQLPEDTIIYIKEDNIAADSSSPSGESSPPPDAPLEDTDSSPARIVAIFDELKKINPYQKYANKTHRKAITEMIKERGFERTRNLAEAVVENSGKPFFPVVSNPYEMQTKFLKIKTWLDNN
jgi:DNA-binding Lrp family transcriptional regulator